MTKEPRTCPRLPVCMKLLVEDFEDRVKGILAVLFRGGDRRGLLLALGALTCVRKEVRVARLLDLDGFGLFLVKAGGNDGDNDLVGAWYFS